MIKKLRCIFCPQTKAIHLTETDLLAPLPHHIDMKKIKRDWVEKTDPFEETFFYKGLYTFSDSGFEIKPYELVYANPQYEIAVFPPQGLCQGHVFWVCEHCHELLQKDVEKIYDAIISKSQEYFEFRDQAISVIAEPLKN